MWLCAALDLRVMLVLFCMSLILKEPDSIPHIEIAFYVFMAVSLSLGFTAGWSWVSVTW